LKQRAAQAMGQGWKSIAVEPAHLLALTLDYTPPPPPTELERRVEGARDLVRSRDLRIRTLEDALRRATERGKAEGHRESAEELRRLRVELAQVTQALHEAQRDGQGLRRARAVGTPV
jgi:hypothetical protein